MNRFSYLGFACVIGLSVVASACGDDEDDGNGNASGAPGAAGSSSGGGGGLGNAGSSSAGAGGSATAGATASGGSAGAASGGSAGSGAGGGASGGAAGSAGTGGEGGEGQSTACSAFPKTVTLGESIGLNMRGAVLCYEAASEACRLTTNTFSDGDNPCPTADNAMYFIFDTESSEGSVQLGEGWTWNSASDGTVSVDETRLSAIEVDTEITAEIELSGGGTYDVVFSFDGDSVFTIKSFTKN